MTPREIVENLRLLNRWRRGEDESLPMPEPSDVGCWVDAAADALETVGQLRQRAEQAEAEIERWRVATAKLRDGAEEAGRVANEQIARAEARVKEPEACLVASRADCDRRDEWLVQERDDLAALRAANAELAGALRALSQAVHAKIQVQGADGNYVLSMDVASADRILARHASGVPAKPVIDAEALIRECIPGGSIADPQAIADAIRGYAARKEAAS